MTRSKILAAAAASALALTYGTAASALTTFSLNLGNADIAGFPSPYGSVDVNLVNATTADVTFTAGAVGNFKYFFIANSAADVNVNATSWSFSNLTGNGGALSDGGSSNVDGHGIFNQTFDQFDGFGQPSTTISFRLTDLSGTWASSDNVLTANAGGHSVAAHIAVCDLTANPTCNSDLGAVKTGFATNGPGGGVIPEPATWGLMLVGFFGAGALLRSRRIALTVA
jgi:hypothetical protein